MLPPDDDFGIDCSAGDEDTLYAFYDLKWFPVDSDLCFFLMSAEVARNNQGLRHIVLIFMPGTAPHDATDHLAWRFNHILLPLIPMFPSVSGVIVAPSRAEGFFHWARAAHRFPDRCDSANLPFTPRKEFCSPTFVQMAKNPGKYLRPRATGEAVKKMEQELERLGSRRLVVITLRQTRFGPNRNSNVEAWMKFAESLDPDLYVPLFVPDTETAFTADFGRWKDNCMFDAAFDLQLRMALYEMAWLNLSVSCGPFAIMTLNERCRALGFKFVVVETSEASVAGLEEMGFPAGKNPLYATPFQRWVWRDDDFPIIKHAFNDMVQFIDASEGEHTQTI